MEFRTDEITVKTNEIFFSYLWATDITSFAKGNINLSRPPQKKIIFHMLSLLKRNKHQESSLKRNFDTLQTLTLLEFWLQ